MSTTAVVVYWHMVNDSMICNVYTYILASYVCTAWMLLVMSLLVTVCYTQKFMHTVRLLVKEWIVWLTEPDRAHLCTHGFCLIPVVAGVAGGSGDCSWWAHIWKVSSRVVVANTRNITSHWSHVTPHTLGVKCHHQGRNSKSTQALMHSLLFDVT